MVNKLKLGDPILKLQRGEKQRDQLMMQLQEVLNNNPPRLEFKKNSQLEPSLNTHEYSLFIHDIPTIEKNIGMLLGETIQSFRISLDYLAWELFEASGKTLSETEKRKVAFPITESQTKFEGNTQKYLQYFSFDQIRLINQYQPYKNSEAGIAINYLQILSNTDKHRIIVPVFMFAFETQGKLKPVAARTLKVQNNYGDTQELKNGDKILTITMNREPVSWNAEMGIKLVPAISPSIIKPPSPYKIVTLEKVLEIIRQTCFDIISKFKNNP